MSKAVFARKIIQKMESAIGTDGQSFNEGTASAAMTAVAQAITEYLINNTKVIVAYTGMIPGTPPVPDPCVVDEFTIVGACAPPSQSNSFDVWIRQLQKNIIAGFTLAPAGKYGIVFQQTPFIYPNLPITQADINSAHNINDTNPQQKLWEIICGGIIKWINNTVINTIPGAATHPEVGSTGIANITKIILT